MLDFTEKYEVSYKDGTDLPSNAAVIIIRLDDNEGTMGLDDLAPAFCGAEAIIRAMPAGEDKNKILINIAPLAADYMTLLMQREAAQEKHEEVG